MKNTLFITPSKPVNLIVAATISAFITTLWFSITWRYGFDLADEGYYWYGAQRVFRGEVPLRDFGSYDIGRYYWSATFMRLIGNDSLFSARLGAAAYQAIGTLVGVFICLESSDKKHAAQWIYALLVSCTLAIWAKPYYKVYDHATSVIILWMTIQLLQSKEKNTWLFSGMLLGIAATMGRNHGLYGAAASAVAIAIVLHNTKPRQEVIRLCSYFFAGVLIGYAPTLIMMAFVDGFYAAFINSIIQQFKFGATNIALPVPWPWSIDFHRINAILAMQHLAIGFGFVFLIAFAITTTTYTLFIKFDYNNKYHNTILASAITSILYTHYAFSRADVTHLSLGIFPAIIGISVSAGRTKNNKTIPIMAIILAISIITVPPKSILTHRFLAKNYVQTSITNNEFWIKDDLSEDIKTLISIANNSTSAPDKFLALPNMPSINAILGSRIPTWDIYPIVPRDIEFEEQEIARLESSPPETIFLSNDPMASISKYRFNLNRPLTYKWIKSNYTIQEIQHRTSYSNAEVYTINK